MFAWKARSSWDILALTIGRSIGLRQMAIMRALVQKIFGLQFARLR
jgi:hypothetical protein